jgi:dTDP-4-dehydrorhamnose reductase
MKVLVTGGGGQLARALVESQPSHVEILAPRRSECDVTHGDQVEAIVRDFRPTAIINTAAFTAVERAEVEPETAFAVNERGAGNVADAAALTGARLIQLSTDYVFDGAQSTPYETDDAPAPLNVYGRSKLAGEAAVRSAGGTATIIRCGWLFSARGNNFLLTMLRGMKEGRALRVANDQVGVPSSCRDLARFLWWCVGAEGLPPTMHWTNAGTGSWYDFAIAIQKLASERALIGEPVAISAISSQEYQAKAKRPRYSVLDSRESWALSGAVPDHWLAATAKTLDELAAPKNAPARNASARG